MATTDQLIICEHCDCVYQKVTLAKHQKTLCTRCGGVLQRYNGLTVEQRLALTVTALALWMFANFYPVMSISLKGLKNLLKPFIPALLLKNWRRRRATAR